MSVVNVAPSPRADASPAFAKSSRVLALDGLRGLAVGMVVFAHLLMFALPDHAGFALLRSTTRYLLAGVDVFFVLSGFLVGSIVLEHRSSPRMMGTFYLRRTLRIFPVYAMLLASYLIACNSEMISAVGNGIYVITTFPSWSYWLLVQNYQMALEKSLGPLWLVVTWSLAIEEQFYLISPILARIFRPKGLQLLWVAMILICPLLRYVLVVYSGNLHAAAFLTVARFDALALGFLLACLWADERWRKRLVAWSGALGWLAGTLVVVLLTLPHIPTNQNVNRLVFAPCLVATTTALMIVRILARPDCTESRALARPGPRFLGGISYFLYVFHLPAIFTAHAAIFAAYPSHLTAAGTLTSAAAILGCAACAVLSKRIIEDPCIRIGHTRSYWPKAPTAPERPGRAAAC